MSTLQTDILRTVLYYDIFHYPLKADEIFLFLPSNSVTTEIVEHSIQKCVSEKFLFAFEEYFSVDPQIEDLVERRVSMEHYALKRWRIAHIFAHIILRFPFVRGCFITGTLSKHVSTPQCDIDYFVVTETNRLWIARTFLTLFKKIFLLNSKKYFCLNYFVTEDALEIRDRSVFTATEIAHAKPLINQYYFDGFIEQNAWIKSFFPNWQIEKMNLPSSHNGMSVLGRILEIPFGNRLGDKLDDFLMKKMKGIWKKRYPHLTNEKLDSLFRVRKSVSKAHGPDFETKVMNAYKQKCFDMNIELQTN